MPCGSQWPPAPAVPSHSNLLPPRTQGRARPRQAGGIPVVLRCMLVRQHLQVDGLRPPLDAPILCPTGVERGGEMRLGGH